jgi:RNA polymerase sigma-70 factor, ECF subfamily
VIDPTLEAKLVAELRNGDERVRAAALAELFEQLGRSLYRLCLRIACDPADAEDARQETFVEVLRGLPSFRGEARFSTWIFRIAIRSAMRIRGRRGRTLHHDFSSLDDADLRSLRAQDADDGADPSRLVLERESAAKILAAIERLPAPQRTVLGLAALEDLPQVEIAAILGVPVGTVYSRLSAARERLREELAR